MIVDSHVHFGTGNTPLGPADPQQAMARWSIRAQASGINRAVLMAAPVGRYEQANAAVAQYAKLGPARWFWYVFVNTAADRGRIAQIVREAKAKGACGIKVHWLDGQATDELARAAARNNMPVLCDPGGKPRPIEVLSEAHPRVNWIIPHLSSFADNWNSQKSFIELLVQRPNVYTDTAGVRYFDLLVEAVARAGAHKVLFGSDGPYLHPAPELAKVLSLDLHADQRRLMLGGNFLRLTRIARRS